MPGVIPLCVVLNGPSAVGKSTLAKAVQDRLDEPLLRFGVDELYRMVPDQWAGGVADARFADRGFTYRDVAAVPGARRINNGADAVSMLFAMNSAIVGILSSGVGVVVDGQAFEPAVNEDFEKRLRELEAGGLARIAIIELAAADDRLADRQERHAHPAGLSLHQNSLPKQAETSDLVVDTTHMSATEVADLVCDWLERTYPARRADPLG
jgi:chloramphenicol 3-O-phosphotransferase